MQFDMSQIRAEGFSKLLNSLIVPRPIAWITTQDIDGKLNAAPFSHFNVVSANPPVICFGIVGREAGDFKDTGNIIQRTGQFVVNMVSFTNAEQMTVTAVEFGREVDEIVTAALETAPSVKVRPPRIADSPASLECERLVSVQVADKNMVHLARVVMVHVRDDCVLDPDKFYIDSPKLDLIARMHGGGWYARTTDLFERPRIPVEEWNSRKTAAE